MDVLPETWTNFYKEAKEKFGIDLNSDEKHEVSPVSLYDFLEKEMGEIEFVVENLIRSGDLVLLAAKRKCGKSYFIADIFLSLACGGRISERIHSNKSCSVAVVDAEMQGKDIKQRMLQVASLHGGRGDWMKKFLLLSLKDERKNIDLANEADQQWIENRIRGAEVVAFDNYGKLIKPGSEGDVREWRKITGWFDKLRDAGITVILLHHENKDGETRGTMKLEDDVDLLISLKRPKDWGPAHGNIINVEIPAARHLHDDQLLPFTIIYKEDAEGFHRYVTETGIGEECGAEEEGAPMPPRIALAAWHGHQLSPLQAEIMQIVCAHGSVRARDVIDTKVRGRSATSVTNAFNELCSKKLLQPKGETRQARFYIRFE